MNYGNDVVEIRAIQKNVVFRTTKFGGQFVDIGGLRLKKQGVIDEFPDLKDKDDWRKIACDRFKDKIKKMKTEEQIIDYIIKDLTKYGYVPKYLQKEGHRPIKI